MGSGFLVAELCLEMKGCRGACHKDSKGKKVVAEPTNAGWR